MKLSRNFTSDEIYVSEDHPEELEGLEPTKTQINRATLLAKSLWQPTRSYKGSPFTVLSWARTPKLNSLVGGASNSDHLLYTAADMTMDNLKDVFLWMYYQNLPFRELILYPDQNFIHGSINIPGLKYSHEALIKYADVDSYIPFTGGAIPSSKNIDKIIK